MSIVELMQDIDGMREHEGITITELCRKAGVSRKSYTFWVTGRGTPNLSALNSVLEALHIELVPLRTDDYYT